MKIHITKKQYESLAKIVYLGNWMANANRDGSPEDPHLLEYEEIYDYIFSLALQFGFSDTFECDMEFNDDFVQQEVGQLHEEYDENTFWDELPDRLGVRDFYRTYSPEERKKMTEEEHFMKMQDCIIKWENEFEKYGVERLGVVEI